MTFAAVDQWQARPAAPLLARVPIGIDVFPRLHAAITHNNAQRALSAVLAVAVAWLILATMAAWLKVDSNERGRRRANDAIQLIAPRADAGAHPNRVEHGGRTGAVTPVAPTPGTSTVDTSTPTDASILAWSVSRIAAPAPTRAPLGTGGNGAGVGSAAGAGSGGNGVYDPYAGASPQRRGAARDGDAHQPDTTALARVQTAIATQAHGDGGRFQCAVRVGGGGVIINARCTRLSGALGPQSVAAALRGHTLYSPNDAGTTQILMLTI